MAIASTQIGVSSVNTQIIGPATTWANTLGSPNSPVSLYVSVAAGSVGPVFFGSANQTTAATGISLTTANAIPQEFILYPGDALFAITTASTGTLRVMATNQQLS